MWPGMFHATAVLERAMTAVSTTVSEPIKVAIGSFDLIGSTHYAMQPITFQEGATKPIELDVVVEVPRGSFLKRGSTGEVDFISPMPCPFNYGSVPQYLGREGDLLDAVVLGPRLPYGSHVRVKVWGAVILTDHGMSDDKLICSGRPLIGADRRWLLAFSTSMRSVKDYSISADAAQGAMPARGGARPNRRWRVLARDRQRGKDRRLSFDNIGLRRDHDTIINAQAAYQEVVGVHLWF